MSRSTTITTMVGAFVLTCVMALTATSAPQHDLKKKERTDTISVPEMQCGMCEYRIERTIKKLKGVSAIVADAEANHVVVTYNPNTISRQSIEKAIADVGYNAGDAKTTAETQAKLSACCRPGAHDE